MTSARTTALPRPLFSEALLLLAPLLACAGGSRPAKAPAAPADPLAEVAWLEGRWQVAAPAEPASEHWSRVGELLHGVGFTTKAGRTSFFEVLIVSRKEGALVYTALPGVLIGQ
jgi:hypothetical protein